VALTISWSFAMRLTSSTWSGRIFLLLIACVCLGTLGYPGAGLARKEYTSDTRSGEGDPDDGHDCSGGSIGSTGDPSEMDVSSSSHDDEAIICVIYFDSRSIPLFEIRIVKNGFPDFELFLKIRRQK